MEGQGVEEHHEATGADVEPNPELWKDLPSDLTEKLAENLVITESPALGRGEEMNEGHGVVQVYHEAMGEDVELNPAVWSNLPNDLIDVIVEKVLSGLPFSRVLSFCSVCKGWTDFLLSKEYLLYFRSFCECMIFNPRTGLWESMPLPFSQTDADALMLQHMELVACVGGLLYFANAVSDEWILCNPLTRLCRTVRRADAARQISSAKLKTRRSYPSEWRVLFKEVWDPLPFSTHDIIVKITSSSDTGLFHLLLAKHYRHGKPSVQLNVKDSRLSYWVKVPDVHRDFHFIVLPTFLWSEGRVLLGFYTCARGFNALFYDGNEQRCIWSLNVISLQSGEPTKEKTLLTTLNGGGKWEYLELRDGGVTLGTARFPSPTEPLRKNVFYEVLPELTLRHELAEILNFVCLQQGDIVFHICLCRHAPRGPVNVSVSTHSLVDASERISNWMEWPPSTWESLQLPSPNNFFILKPSLSCP